MKQYFEQKKLEAKIGLQLTRDSINEFREDISRVFSEDWFENENTKKKFIIDILEKAGGEISGIELYKQSGFSKIHLNFILNQLLDQGLIKIFVSGKTIQKVKLTGKKFDSKNSFKPEKKHFWKQIFPI